MSEALDLLLDGPGGDGLVDGPLQGAHQPCVAGQPNLAGALVDAFDQFIIEPDRNLLHADTVSELTSDISSDIILGMTKTPVPAPLPFATSVPGEILSQIIFGTRVARFIAITDPDDMPHIVAKRIWENVQCYLDNGDWPDRRKTAAEIDAEDEEAAMPPLRTIADLKRALIVGREFTVTNHLHPNVSGPRRITKVQTKSFRYEFTKADGTKGLNGYTDWPKREEVRFDGADVHFLSGPDGAVAFTYHLGGSR